MVLNEILLRDSELVVELGGGISTLFIARLLRGRGCGQMVTVEHDQAWAERLTGLLEGEGLSDVCKVVHAPLTMVPTRHGDQKWYQPQEVASALSGRVVDLLLVDGPPAYQRQYRFSRFPAVPVLRSLLSDNCVIILDDVGRDGEWRILHEWAREIGTKPEVHLLRGGIGLLRLKEGLTTI